MKTRRGLSHIFLLMAVLSALPFTVQCQTPAPIIPLQLQAGTNGINLIVGNVSQTGALFLQTAADLWSLATNSTPLLQTNTPTTNALQLQAAPSNVVPEKAFFSALFFPGQSVADFGDPEDYIPQPDPINILFSSGLPTNLMSGQAFPIVFIVTDSTGQPVPLTGAATIMVVSTNDGTQHPDATVTPPTGQMTNGFLQMQITINAVTPLDGYTLALSVNPTAQGPVRPLGTSTEFIQIAFDLGPVPLTPQQISYYTQQLAQLRKSNADAGTTWNDPLIGGYGRVSGSFGEWRGDNNNRCHHGLDLAAPAAATVLASRSGVVSNVKLATDQNGNDAHIGWYIVIDHGNGWFSRYLHLDQNHILVHNGQPVAAGANLANQLFTWPDGSHHLHFEIRYDNQNVPRWGEGEPGIAQDPALTPGIFAIPQATALPQIASLGITAEDPSKSIYQPNANPTGANGPVYVVFRTTDLEGGNNVGPRSVSFLPDGAAPQTISPSNDIVIAPYLPYRTPHDPNEGFALYKLANNKASKNDYFRYWFLWDTSSYTANPIGPRSFTASVQGYSGLTTNYTLIFGPKLSILSLGGSLYQLTVTAYLGTNRSTFQQPDAYNLTLSGGATFSANSSAQLLTQTFVTHLSSSTCIFTINDGVDPNTVTVMAQSTLLPNIGDRKSIQSPPGGMALVPAGAFTMGDTLDGNFYEDADPISVTISAFYMDTNLVNYSQWQTVYGWALSNGYDFGNNGAGKAANHPVQMVDWYDVVKWSNARSQQAGLTPVYYTDAGLTQVYRNGELNTIYANWNANGYRLPTEGEWEKAARGGLTGQRFPWGNTISWNQANYKGDPLSVDPNGYSYDLAPFYGYDPAFYDGVAPYTSPVGSFAANGYGLYDMAGDVEEWCWDWYGKPYGQPTTINPTGPSSSSPFIARVLRGSSYVDGADASRCAFRNFGYPPNSTGNIGFRCVRGF